MIRGDAGRCERTSRSVQAGCTVGAARVAIERDKIADVYNRTLNLLIDRGRLTADEARELPLALNVTVDFRSNRRQPLPDVAPPAR